MSQRELAEVLGLAQSHVSRIESGRRPARDIGLLMRMATVLDIPPADLGLSGELLRSVSSRPTPSGMPAPSPAEDVVVSSDAVVASQDRWREARRYLNAHRGELARQALSLYQPGLQLDGTTLLAPAEWLPVTPVRLDDVFLEWRPEQQARPKVTGAEPETGPIRPLRSPGHQYERYTSAVRYLDPPILFENRPSYQLLDVDWTSSAVLRFGLATYFDKLDVCEAVGHELAAAHRSGSDEAGPGWSALPFRSLIGDPCDPHRRALLPAVTTLILRRRQSHGTASFFLHWRDPARVATAGGIYDVIPAGEFQPSSVAVWDQQNDFSLWRNIVRELSEELLGTPEHDGSRSTPIDYSAWPLFTELERARAAGQAAVYCLGVAVDALTLAATIMTVLVIDDTVFDAAFGDAEMVKTNAEGNIVTRIDEGSGAIRGIPFTEATVTRFVEREPMASPGSGCLKLAWRHRIALLSG